jgi:hypothetical protein
MRNNLQTIGTRVKINERPLLAGMRCNRLESNLRVAFEAKVKLKSHRLSQSYK